MKTNNIQTAFQVCKVLSRRWQRVNVMGTFMPYLSPVTGKMEWILRDEDYDYHQEIARSAYADMLHDTERNQKYYKGLQAAIKQMHDSGRQAHVLDIGTGSGLLAMMAASCGADTITACEAFHPMSQCASKVMKHNGYGDKIHLIPKRSTEVKVSQDGDMPHRANILVTEVFDTELIGEGAIGTFHHAHQQLLEKDCLVIPRAANMYIQLVQSERLRQWNQLQPIRIKGYDDVRPPVEFSKCGGAPSLHDLQLSQIPTDEFQIISQPIKVFRFDYTGKSEIKFRDSSEVTVSSLLDGRVDAVFMWWDIEMDPQGEITLSCAPKWAHPTPCEMQWRDHWMQAVYYPYRNPAVRLGEEISVLSNHDDYSLWFDVTTPSNDKHRSEERAVCMCGAHIAYSRPRIAMLNDTNRNNLYIETLKQVITPQSVCLCLGDGSLLPLISSQLRAKKVFTLQSNPLCRRTLQSYCKENGTENNIEIIDKLPSEVNTEDFHNQKIDIVIAEPFFLISVLPWDNLQMLYALREMSNHLSEDVKIFPLKASLHLIPMEFTDLWRIRAPVGNCEGFDLTIFDELIESSSDKTDAYVEPHPLWEYPGKALSQQITAMDFKLSSLEADSNTKVVESQVQFECEGTCNGVALWMDYEFGENRRVPSGPITPPVPGSFVTWDRCTRQGVHLLKQQRSVTVENQLSFKVTFKQKSGEFDFSFQIT